MKPSVFVGIAGGTCSGKTLVAKRITERVGTEKVLILSQDNYYKDLAEIAAKHRAHWDFDHPDSFDTGLLHQHLDQLKSGEPIVEPVYSFTEHVRLDRTITRQPRPVIIIEGILILDDRKIREGLDFKVYVDEQPDIRLARRLQRDEIERGRSAQSVLVQYMETVRPAHEQFVEPSKRYADIIIPGGGENIPAIEILSNHIITLLERSEG